MKYLYFIFAVLALFLAHIFKIARQKQFIEIYEEPNEKVLLKGLSISYIINFLLPFKLGYIFRIIYPGKRMKNGVSFSLATIIIDIMLDFLVVTILYSIFFLCNFEILNTLKYYIIISCFLLIAIVIALFFNKYIKKIILKIAAIFNENIELKILKTSWFTITSFKDMLEKINKVKLVIFTVIPWGLYILSYYNFSLFLQQSNVLTNLEFIEVFNIFYSINGLSIPTFFIFQKWNAIHIELLSFILFPLVLIYIFSYIYKPKRKQREYIEILPQINVQDRLAFLETYFKANDREYIKNYININNDVAIIEDFSAGSNATTMLCCKEGKTFFRKYSFGSDAKKLYKQIEWIKAYSNVLKLTSIDHIKNSESYCSYDMPYNPNAVTCFNYIHTVPLEKSWEILEKVLKDIAKNLHTLNLSSSNINTINQYIDEKVLANIEKIEKSFYIQPLLKYDYIYINDKKYKNLTQFYKYLNKDYLSKLFINDPYASIHGDFTIENIICIKNNSNKSKDYYIIDPNTGNIHESPYLDYAKLLQSLHGGYEFLMNTKKVEVHENRIDFMFTKSSVYNELFTLYKKYLENQFNHESVKSIFFHEIIHWLRLLPYKIEKNGERVVIFYAGLIQVLNDVENMYFLEKRNKNEKK